MAVLLEVNNLKTQFRVKKETVYAVNGISYNLHEGETLAIVGESGSGKSVGVLSLLQLIPTPPGEITGGTAMFQGQDLLHLSYKEIRKVRGKEISVIFQDPMTSLNPVIPVGKQIIESLQLHLKMPEKDARNRTIELLELVGIPSAASRIKNYPHQFSGGMRQRVMIALGLSCDPKLLIADEPTTALDVTIQAQIVNLIKDLRNRLGMSILWITHDLGVVAGFAQRVIVMYAGLIMEEADVKELYKNPLHPYTSALLASLPHLNTMPGEKLKTIEGLPPHLTSSPQRCPFLPRCEKRIKRCEQDFPELVEVDTRHKARCWLVPSSSSAGEQSEEGS